jgi:hypothetical protein
MNRPTRTGTKILVYDLGGTFDVTVMIGGRDFTAAPAPRRHGSDHGWSISSPRIRASSASIRAS